MKCIRRPDSGVRLAKVSTTTVRKILFSKAEAQECHSRNISPFRRKMGARNTNFLLSSELFLETVNTAICLWKEVLSLRIAKMNQLNTVLLSLILLVSKEGGSVSTTSSVEDLDSSTNSTVPSDFTTASPTKQESHNGRPPGERNYTEPITGKDVRKSRRLCLSEDCVLAAATILSSLDRSVDPCEDFYQYACGGWIQRSIVSDTDRFTVVDKRNQNLIRKLLEKSSPDPDEYPRTAEEKARTFYRSCISKDEDQDRTNLQDLAAIVDYAGGWALSGTHVNSIESDISFEERVQILHNKLGLNAFFTWGVIEHEGRNRMAVIAGGWNDGMIVPDGDGTEKHEYLKLMSMFTMLLSQASEEQIVVDLRDNPDNEDFVVQYSYDDEFVVDQDGERIANSSFNITYEYEDIVEDHNSHFVQPEEEKSPFEFFWSVFNPWSSKNDSKPPQITDPLNLNKSTIQVHSESEATLHADERFSLATIPSSTSIVAPIIVRTVIFHFL